MRMKISDLDFITPREEQRENEQQMLDDLKANCDRIKQKANEYIEYSKHYEFERECTALIRAIENLPVQWHLEYDEEEVEEVRVCI